MKEIVATPQSLPGDLNDYPQKTTSQNNNQ
jgi:hypothetical protein